MAAGWNIKSLLICLKLILICSLKPHRKIKNEITWFPHNASVLSEKQSQWKILPRLKPRSIWQLVFLLSMAVPLECYLLSDQTLTSVGAAFLQHSLWCWPCCQFTTAETRDDVSQNFHSPLLVSNENSEISRFQMSSKNDKGPYHNTARLLSAKSAAL